MNIIYALLLCTIAGLSTMIGGLFIFIPKFNKKYLCLFLSFSVIIIIGISLFDLIPNALPVLVDKFHIFSIVIVLILLVIGFLIIKIFNSINMEKGSLYNLGIVSMIVLMIHNFPEGIITFLTSYLNQKIGLKLTIAIALHNIPEGIMIAMPIYYAKGSRRGALWKTFVASFAEPLGAIISYLFLRRFINKYEIAVLLIIVAGLMLNLAIEDIIPNIKKYYNYLYVLLGLSVGVIVLLISLFI